jgi:outer membrane protein assembly factor BamB
MMRHVALCCRFSALAVAAACGASTSSATPDSTQGGSTPLVTVDGHDWTRFNVDEARSGVFDAPTGINAEALPTMSRQQVAIDGTVDAAPIYLHNVKVGSAAHDVFFVTTTYGKTIAIDANDGAILWEFTPTGYTQWAGSSRITNATPVADPDRTAIYAASPDGHIQKLAVADGHVLWSTSITTLPSREKIASALNYSRGHILAVTGGYIGDAPPYQGHVAVLDAVSGALLHVWNSLCSDRGGLLDPSSCSESGSASWGRAGAVVDSATGNIFIATGNARWDGRTSWGDAVIELDPSASQVLANYTPSNTETLNSADADVGSTSPVIVDATHVVQGGKDGTLRVLDLQTLAGAVPHRGGEAQGVSTPSGSALFSAPVVWHRPDGVWIFAGDGGSTAAWTYRNGVLTKAWTNGGAGTSPVIAGGLLYVFDPRGVLRVHDPVTGASLAQLQTGSGHWNSPIVVDRRIALAEGSANSHRTSGVLNIWRLP